MKTRKTLKQMSPAQKRVAIAKDVLDQIAKEQFLAARGNFVTVNIGYYVFPDVINKKYLLSDEVEYCKVCAVGAAIVSGIRLFNKVKFYDTYISPGESWDLIRHFFETEQAILIENAFEKGDGYYNKKFWRIEGEELPNVDTRKAISFGKRYINDTERLVAIFENIVKNKGTFKL